VFEEVYILFHFNIILKHNGMSSTKNISNIMIACLYSCVSYRVCKAHFFGAILYCHLWPLWLY